MTERIMKCFRVQIQGIGELESMRALFGDDKFNEIIFGMGSQVAAKIREQRNPATGEFPVVNAYSVADDALCIEVEATPATHEFLSTRLAELEFNFKDTKEVKDKEPSMTDTPKPIAFLAHASEDHLFAKRIAEALVAAGIYTFLDEWELRSGDSIRRKLEQGIEQCTHFIALLSPVSVSKDWVNLEIDAGIIGMVGGKNRFVGLRFGIAPAALSPFLQTLWLPSISAASIDADLKLLVNDIYGVSRRPPLGPVPTYANAGIPELSAAASAVARHFVERSELGVDYDPQTNVGELQEKLGMTEEDIVDGIDELKGLGCIRMSPHFGPRNTWTLGPQKRLFTRFDKHWKDWDPSKDAIVLARRVQDNEAANTEEAAQKLGWSPRRINPALAYLIDRELVMSSQSSSHPFVSYWVRSTDETRRFLKGQS
jgi:hypothetical protein